jgi:tripartite-type tricarboxylate transporter receptor subunit TctC
MFASRVLLVALLCSASSSAFSQNYPSRTARMIVPWTAGARRFDGARRQPEIFESFVSSSSWTTVRAPAG